MIQITKKYFDKLGQLRIHINTNHGCQALIIVSPTMGIKKHLDLKHKDWTHEETIKDKVKFSISLNNTMYLSMNDWKAIQEIINSVTGETNG